MSSAVNNSFSLIVKITHSIAMQTALGENPVTNMPLSIVNSITH